MILFEKQEVELNRNDFCGTESLNKNENENDKNLAEIECKVRQ